MSAEEYVKLLEDLATSCEDFVEKGNKLRECRDWKDSAKRIIEDPVLNARYRSAVDRYQRAYRSIK